MLPLGWNSHGADKLMNIISVDFTHESEGFLGEGLGGEEVYRFYSMTGKTCPQTRNFLRGQC